MVDTRLRTPRLLPRPVLLLGVLLIAGASGPGRAAAEDPKPDDLVAKIQQLGGKVDRDEKAEGKPVTVVNFATTQVGDEALAEVKSIATLRKLTLNGTKVTDAGLEQLKGLTGLEKLYLVDTKVTDAGLAHLAGLKELKILSLVGTEVTDAGLDHLKGLEKLEDLFLYATKVTEEGAKKLKETLTKVRIDR